MEDFIYSEEEQQIADTLIGSDLEDYQQYLIEQRMRALVNSRVLLRRRVEALEPLSFE
tara:strand:+ start:402 stop:575 length:174 start_codon:yes stop_codon:yes gene_type:complete